MPDYDTVAAFAAWLGGLLPRLALYPGGIGMILALIAARAHPGGPAAGDPALARLALALAWVGVALVPAPGAAPLPGAPDLLVLIGLLAAAEVLVAPTVPLACPTEAVSALALRAGALLILAGAGDRLTLPLPPGSLWLILPAGLAFLVGWLQGIGRGEGGMVAILSALGWGALGGGVLGGAALPTPWDGVGLALIAGVALGWGRVPGGAMLARRAGPLGWAALAVAVVAALLGPA